MNQHFLGVDIGNTKSHAIIADEQGHILGFGQGGCGSPEVLGYGQFAESLGLLTNQALQASGLGAQDISAGGFGVAGYDWPSQHEPCMAGIQALGLGGHSMMVNDALVGMLAGAPSGWGIGLVAGTGSNCWGMDVQGRMGRMTGLSHLMDEGGGAGHLVLWALQAVGRAWTQRGPQTIMTDLFLKAFGESDPLNLFERLAQHEHLVDPALAPLVIQTAEVGDEAALGVIQQAIESLTSLCIGVARQLDLLDVCVDVVLIGGVFKAGEILITPLRAAITARIPAANLIRLEAPPVVGGVVLAMRQVGLQLSEDGMQRLQAEAVKLTAES